MTPWTVKEVGEYVLKLCSECSGEQFTNEKVVRALVAYKVLQFFCRKGFEVQPMAPRTMQTLASDVFAALRTCGAIVNRRTLVSDKDIIMFRDPGSIDISYFEECYRSIRGKNKEI